MTKLILARHGIYQNPEDIIPFRSNDVSLSVEGIEQIERNASFLKSFGVSQIYSSLIKRCEETAQIYSRILNVGIEYNADLNEIDSPYQNISRVEYKKLMSEHSLYADNFHLSKNGESIEVVNERLERILKKALKENYDKTALIVSHGDPIMILFLMVQKQNFDINKTLESQTDYIKKGGMIELNFDGDKFINYTKHFY